MNRRIQKKRWKEDTTAKQVDLLERVEALEKLSQRMTAEQTAQRERVSAVSDDLMTYKAAQRQRQEREAWYRARQERIRWEREQERRDFRMKLARGAAMLTFAVSFLIFALMLPAPERAEEPGEAQTVVAEADPAAGVVRAVALSQEG